MIKVSVNGTLSLSLTNTFAAPDTKSAQEILTKYLTVLGDMNQSNIGVVFSGDLSNISDVVQQITINDVTQLGDNPKLSYDSQVYNDFVDNMELAGFAPIDYEGRFKFHGPAVICDQDQIQDVIRATAIRVTWDLLGQDYAVYPEES